MALFIILSAAAPGRDQQHIWTEQGIVTLDKRRKWNTQSQNLALHASIFIICHSSICTSEEYTIKMSTKKKLSGSQVKKRKKEREEWEAKLPKMYSYMQHFNDVPESITPQLLN